MSDTALEPTPRKAPWPSWLADEPCRPPADALNELRRLARRLFRTTASRSGGPPAVELAIGKLLREGDLHVLAYVGAQATIAMERRDFSYDMHKGGCSAGSTIGMQPFRAGPAARPAPAAPNPDDVSGLARLQERNVVHVLDVFRFQVPGTNKSLAECTRVDLERAMAWITADSASHAKMVDRRTRQLELCRRVHAEMDPTRERERTIDVGEAKAAAMQKAFEDYMAGESKED